MNKKFALPFALNNIKLIATFFVDETYSQRHAHMIHSHQNVLELLYICSGKGRYLVGNREYAVHSGDLIICNAGILHGEAPFQQHDMQTYCCALSGININGLPPNCLIDYSHKPVFSFKDTAEHLQQLMPMLHEFYMTLPNVVSYHLAISILLLVYEQILKQQKCGQMEHEQKNENLVRKITEFIDGHYKEPIKLSTISCALHISSSLLSHVFKQETGLSPIQYVIQRRIGEAQSLLMETHLSIREIEESLGFGSSVHFSAMFKKYVGISPKDYRNHFKK
ncbi:AraC family transcriptional regulator|uniref:AraC-type DNA-binding protein n=1 Tax=Dendrosporobacter quercicolus TaxID=146817 RepID=A0A1G9RWW4_9FIRM|nr:AraC family transcriptional regulator [Dendrosporobacter quercicolus]NSL49337.1 AraC family transcriptional regulator [Dendrosporobacter quercicolus DSM 1736]SDM26975.1 AraC-type DNA-binding protein [Dendrosporobacter quercicolus]